MDGIRLLVVEDDLAVSAMWADLFSESGATVLGPCRSSVQALALLASERPDVALLDIEIWQGDSFPIARALRTFGVPFVFLSSIEPNDIPAEFSETPFLRKPSNARDVFNALLKAAGRER